MGIESTGTFSMTGTSSSAVTAQPTPHFFSFGEFLRKFQGVRKGSLAEQGEPQELKQGISEAELFAFEKQVAALSGTKRQAGGEKGEPWGGPAGVGAHPGQKKARHV